MAVNNTVVDRVASVGTAPTVDANSVNPRQNLNKYSHNNTGGSNVFNNRMTVMEGLACSDTSEDGSRLTRNHCLIPTNRLSPLSTR